MPLTKAESEAHLFQLAHALITAKHYPTVADLTASYDSSGNYQIVDRDPIRPGKMECLTTGASPEWVHAFVLVSLIHHSLDLNEDGKQVGGYSCGRRKAWRAKVNGYELSDGCSVVGIWKTAGVRICSRGGSLEKTGRWDTRWTKAEDFACDDLVVMLWSLLGNCKTGKRIGGGYEFGRGRYGGGRVEIFHS